MANDTSIEWTDVTWNPTRGCRRVSPGCGGAKGEGGCYAERMAARFSGPGQPYEGLVRIGPNGPRWTGAGRLIPEKLVEPLSWKKPRTVFVDSMSDLFFEAFSNEEIAAVFGVMASARTHTFQVLTKRAERMRSWFEWVFSHRSRVGEGAGKIHPFGVIADAAARRGASVSVSSLYEDRGGGPAPWPLPNVWLGVSVEDQQRADERIHDLLATPAAVRFLSVEPLLGPVDLAPWLAPDGPAADGLPCADCGSTSDCDCEAGPVGIDWVIAGSESGPGARAMNEDWVRSLRDQCVGAGTRFFYKQRLEGRRVVSLPMLDGRCWNDMPEARP